MYQSRSDATAVTTVDNNSYTQSSAVAGVTVSIPATSIIGDIVQEQTPYIYAIWNSMVGS
jgi:hypothetical protein